MSFFLIQNTTKHTNETKLKASQTVLCLFQHCFFTIVWHDEYKVLFWTAKKNTETSQKKNKFHYYIWTDRMMIKFMTLQHNRSNCWYHAWISFRWGKENFNRIFCHHFFPSILIGMRFPCTELIFARYL